MKLGGSYADSIASKIGHIPFNYKKQRWAKSTDYLELSKKLYAIEKVKPAPLVEAGQMSGSINMVAAKLTGIPQGTKIIACESYKGCETITPKEPLLGLAMLFL